MVKLYILGVFKPCCKRFRRKALHGPTVEPGYSEVHKSNQSFHYSYYFTIARVKYMFSVQPGSL